MGVGQHHEKGHIPSDGTLRRVDYLDALDRIAYLLERTSAPTYRVRAFRTAAATLRHHTPSEVARRARAGQLKDLQGIGDVTAAVVVQALDGQVPDYLANLEREVATAEAVEDRNQSGKALRQALRGDCHTHSDWSDGGSAIMDMALAARRLGHRYMVLTDHSPRLTVAHGLTADRLRTQMEVVAGLNADLAPFRILTGIEVDILDDGALDQDDDLLSSLDVVVASVHSKLRMAAPEMTRRMVAAVRNPRVDILGHCTGRLLTSRGRPESTFDADAVFGACAESGTAVEINCRPERLDPPLRLLKKAVEAGTWFAIDTDAHAPGQLEWQPNGCVRAVEAGIPVERVVNAWSANRLREWAAAHES